jgi:protein O-GlcNAc transferase
MKKVVSFSLYGNDPIYTIGCLKNAEIKNKIMSDWEMWVYTDNSVDEKITNELTQLGVVLIYTDMDISFGRMWRFLPASEDVDYFISRDTDSRLSMRDVVSTQEWIDSKKSFHIVREHPLGHHWWMNAGMWGCKKGSIPDIRGLIMNYSQNSKKIYDKFFDQYFLEDVIYPISKNDALIHDEFCNMETNSVEIKRDRLLDDFAFIGESVDEFDVPRGDQRSPIKKLYYDKKNEF